MPITLPRAVRVVGAYATAAARIAQHPTPPRDPDGPVCEWCETALVVDEGEAFEAEAWRHTVLTSAGAFPRWAQAARWRACASCTPLVRVGNVAALARRHVRALRRRSVAVVVSEDEMRRMFATIDAALVRV